MTTLRETEEWNYIDREIDIRLLLPNRKRGRLSLIIYYSELSLLIGIQELLTNYPISNNREFE